VFLSDRDFHPTVGAYSQAHSDRGFAAITVSFKILESDVDQSFSFFADHRASFSETEKLG
jgi:hypothetical protein